METLLLVTLEELVASETGSGGDPSARTPHLDRLARRGIQAVEATVTSLGTRPTLASILTGLPPREHGIEDGRLPLANVPTLAEILDHCGMRTAAFSGSGAATSRTGLARGFDLFDARHEDREPRRSQEPWNAPGHESPDAIAASLASWREETPGPAFAWAHLAAEPASTGPTRAWDLDLGLGRVLRAVDDAFVLTTGTGPEPVPFVLSGDVVLGGRLRAGRTSVADAAPILGAAGVGPDALAAALRDPPADRAIEAPTDPLLRSSVPGMASGHLTRAREADRASRWNEAREAYDSALLVEPRLVSARMRAAELAHRQGESQRAVDHAQEILRLVPEHREARVLIARVLFSQEDARASGHANAVLEDAPRHSLARIIAGEIAFADADPALAVDHLRNALAVTGDDPETLLDLGRALSRVGLHADAIDVVTRAAERGDRSPLARYTLAYVLERGERYPESVHEYAGLIRDHPEYLPPYRNLGVLMARDGEVERAIRLWERALEMHPGDPGLEANLREARKALGLAELGG